MKIIYNNIIPFRGFKAINLFGVLFVRRGETMDCADINHEKIHTAQMREMLYIFFYLWYVIEWLVRLIRCKDSFTAYRRIGFEREAYNNHWNRAYLGCRRRFAWWGYMKKR